VGKTASFFLILNMKDQEWSGLMKIPDEIIISELRIEIGKLKSYIDELDYTLQDKEAKNIKQTKLDHLNDELIDCKDRIVSLNRRNEVLQKEIMQLLKTRIR
jgi:hypothetical protein